MKKQMIRKLREKGAIYEHTHIHMAYTLEQARVDMIQSIVAKRDTDKVAHTSCSPDNPSP